MCGGVEASGGGQKDEPHHLGVEAERGRVNHTQRAGVPATTQRFKDNFESLETDGGIKQLVMLLSNHWHMCWEWGGGGPSLKSSPTKLLPLHVNKHMHTLMSRISTNATMGKGLSDNLLYDVI